MNNITPKSILDPKFAYTPACATTPEYLREKFERIRQELQKQQTTHGARNDETDI